MLIDGKTINYKAEKYHSIQFKEYREIIEGIKHKFKWTFDAEYDENYLEELLINEIVSINKENI